MSSHIWKLNLWDGRTCLPIRLYDASRHQGTVLPEEPLPVYQDRIYALELTEEGNGIWSAGAVSGRKAGNGADAGAAAGTGIGADAEADADPHIPELLSLEMNDGRENLSPRGKDGRYRLFRGGREKPLFEDAFAYAELRVRIRLPWAAETGREAEAMGGFLFSEQVLELVSGNIPVLLPEGGPADQVSALIQAVYQHRDSPLISLRSTGSGGRSALLTQLQLAEELGGLYSRSLPFFRSRCRYRIVKEPAVDWADRMHGVSRETVQYLSRHPEELYPSGTEAGIPIGGTRYLPRKALSLRSAENREIYENKVLAGFLWRILDQLQGLQLRCRSLQESLHPVSAPQQGAAGYLFSPGLLAGITDLTLEDILQRLEDLIRRFSLLRTQYLRIFRMADARLEAPPHPTDVFLRVPQYHAIFSGIHRWFHYGLFALEGEDQLVHLLRSSALYEAYCLWRLGELLEQRGLHLVQGAQRRYLYSMPAGTLFRNTEDCNTFVFRSSDGAWAVTLYVQPVLKLPGRQRGGYGGENGIFLFRNNSLPLDLGQSSESGRNFGSAYCNPDFLLKAERTRAAGARYLILDAKYSSADTVRELRMRELAVKYLLSVGSSRPDHLLAGMAALYARPGTERSPEDLPWSIYTGSGLRVAVKMVLCAPGQDLPGSLLDVLGLPASC